MKLYLALLVVGVLALLFVLVLAPGRRGDPELAERQARELEAAKQRATDAEALIRQLRELAWENREQAPVLSDVMLAEIRRFEDRPPAIEP